MENWPAWGWPEERRSPAESLLRWRELRADNMLRFERRFVRMCCIFLIAYTTIYSGSYKVESKGELITKILYIMTWSNS